ncbi:amidohydrolase family protein [Roseobacter sp. YSTF-M11]|uniref:Amidohydrolase family protein n=1 Tax=Roseobacter insulae TaxID=2859783 RepID=A0A9X1JY25_9RHOB|nr:amidohydrolase family protein [Roseobacter insulae]MBW4707775.1 amidohydrolase family protein [Roseobacter insulae]
MDKPDARMPPAPQKPARRAPQGACDAHVHLVAGANEYPLWHGRAENPAPGPDLEGWLDKFRAQLGTLGFARGIIVHSILYGTDNSVTVEAVRRMGHGFKGVGLLPDGANDKQLDQFVDWNMTAVRLNYVHGGVLSWEGARAMAPALAERGLHIQMLCHADQHMGALADDIRDLAVPVVFDHIGWPRDALTAKSAGFETLCALLSEGKVWVKLSALYRMCAAPYGDADPLVAALIAANPERCLWGSDWPHLMLADAQMPQAADLLNAFDRVVTDDATRHRILVDNPAEIFGFSTG